MSNRDRVGRAFETLAVGMRPYVERRMRATSRSGSDWLRTFLASQSPPLRGDASLDDPAFLLRVVADAWETAFRSELGRTERNLVFELRDTRNNWAHNERFSVDDTYRALDTIERLLTAMDAREAAEVGAAKVELMRVAFEAQARKAVPSPDVLMTQRGGLKPWREVIQPHDDVARGRFSLAEFAADLYQVSQGEGAAEYADPVEFFRRTFLTVGLRQLLGDAVARLTTGGGSPVVDLQTSFGGGKTHSMIALYHLCSGVELSQLPPEVQEVVRAAGATELPTVRRAVVVGTRLPPGQPTVKKDGTQVHTLWGELAWQLGGRESFALVAEADRTGTNPGDALRTVLDRAGPCLVLIDEWVAYARALYHDDSLPAGSFDTHFSFAQMLTEAARSSAHALLVVSLPASQSDDDKARSGGSGGPVGSEHEVGGPGGRAALLRLRAVIGRLESAWRPATADEGFEIVRRRLFQPIEASQLTDRDTTAIVLGDLYRKDPNEYPAECREAAYVDKIKRAYPIHPELFARLYEDWSTLDRFQRTRGVLRLLATVIHALWAGGDQSPIILPASVPLAESAVSVELLRNLEDNWKPIIDADVDGPGSLPRALDDEVKALGRYGAARRVARCVFLGSAPLVGTPNQGLDAARLRLGCALPGESVAVYGDALNRLADKATYLYAGAGRYWYGTQPGVARLARDRAERLLAGDRHEVRAAIVTALDAQGRHREDLAGVHVAPVGPAGVADEPSARLVVLAPDEPHKARSDGSLARAAAASILASRGAGPRQHASMLVFVAADERQVADLEQAVAEQLAWRSMVEGAATPAGLSREQADQATARASEAAVTAEVRLLAAYQWLLVPRQPEPTADVVWDEHKLDGQGRLTQRVSRKLSQVGALYTRYPPVLLRLHLEGALASLWKDGAATADRLWDAYSRYLYLHRLKNVDVLLQCIAAGPSDTVWTSEGFAVAEALDPRSPGRFVGLVTSGVASGVRGSTLVVHPDLALAQVEAEQRAEDERRGRDAGEDDGGATGTDGGGATGDAGDPTAATKRRFYGVVAVEPSRLPRDAGKIAQEVVAHLDGLVGTELQVTIEIRATNADGFPDRVMKIVEENAAALRFTDHGFEAT